MSKDSKLNQVAPTTNGNVYDVREMPFLRNAIRMEIDWLKLFCSDRSLPLFSLKVGEAHHGNISFSVRKSFKKFFTFYNDWVFFADECMPTEKCAVEMRA